MLLIVLVHRVFLIASGAIMGIFALVVTNPKWAADIHGTCC